MIDMTRHQLNFRVSADLLDRLKLVSDSQNLSVSSYCIRAIEFCLDSQISFIPSGGVRSQSPPIDMDILGSVRECQQANNHEIESRLVAIESRLVAIESRLDPVTVEMLDNPLDNNSQVVDPVTVEMLDNPLDNNSQVVDPMAVETIDNPLDNDSQVVDPMAVEMLDNPLDNDSQVVDPMAVETIDNPLDNDSQVVDPMAVETIDNPLDNDSQVVDPMAVEDEIRKLRTVDKLSFAKMYKVLNASGYRLPNGNKFRSEDVSAIADRLGLPPIK